MLDSTFRILQWRSETRQGSLGTVLLLSDMSKQQQQVVAVTAKHVLEAFSGEYVTVELRERDRSGVEMLVPCQIKVRDHGTALYAAHPTADIAALRLSVPSVLDVARLARLDWLATEDVLRRIGLQTGDPVYELGFPLGVAANSVGYPILRSGILASYPLLPLGGQQLLADIPVYEGDSGGPVYAGTARTDDRSGEHPWILGLVSGGLNSTLTPHPESLGISVIVPASAIRDAINRLPPAAAGSLAVCRALPE